MDTIYHLALVNDWQATKDIYYPPTYEQDGFTHATATMDKLLEVANHFYQESEGDWLCLALSLEQLAAHQLEVKFEAPAAVGDQDGELSATDTTRFPHIYGGIPKATVTKLLSVERGASGEFLGIGD